jgi:hypothetical protein
MFCEQKYEYDASVLSRKLDCFPSHLAAICEDSAICVTQAKLTKTNDKSG